MHERNILIRAPVLELVSIDASILIWHDVHVGFTAVIHLACPGLGLILYNTVP